MALPTWSRVHRCHDDCMPWTPRQGDRNSPRVWNEPNLLVYRLYELTKLKPVTLATGSIPVMQPDLTMYHRHVRRRVLHS